MQDARRSIDNLSKQDTTGTTPQPGHRRDKAQNSGTVPAILATMDIAQGPDSLYVAGERKISVYRCRVFIRHLNLTPSSLKLSEFNGICIDTSGHIIVSDRDYGVYVFRASGECVGHVSRDVIHHPTGVSVDEDGFVYVCSFYNSEVYIF